jgi:hypothetical protein
LAGNRTRSGPSADLAVKASAMRSPSDQSQSDKARTPARPPSREDRLKAALKANMARRKAQARARSADQAGGATENEE